MFSYEENVFKNGPSWLLNTQGISWQAEFFFCDSFLSGQNENLVCMLLEPLAGQEDRRKTLLHEESVPEITAGTHCTFISLSPSADFSRACSPWDQAVRAPAGQAGWSHKGWHWGCSHPGGEPSETSALTWSVTQGSVPTWSCARGWVVRMGDIHGHSWRALTLAPCVLRRVLQLSILQGTRQPLHPHGKVLSAQNVRPRCWETLT